MSFKNFQSFYLESRKVNFAIDKKNWKKILVADANSSFTKNNVKVYKCTEKYIHKDWMQPIYVRWFCIQRILSYFLGLVSGKHIYKKLSKV